MTSEGQTCNDRSSGFPIAEKPKSTDEKLISPKKLALNGNASTTEVRDVDSEDDDGWIIDEGISMAKEAKDQPEGDGIPLGISDTSDRLISENYSENGTHGMKGRRKQVYPKLNVADSPVIPASCTPIRGWKDSNNPALGSSTTLESASTIYKKLQDFNTGADQSLIIGEPTGISNFGGEVVPIVKQQTSNQQQANTSTSERAMMPIVGPFSIKEHAISSISQEAVMPMVDPSTMKDLTGISNSERPLMTFPSSLKDLTGSSISEKAIKPNVDPFSTKELTGISTSVIKAAITIPSSIKDLSGLSTSEKASMPIFDQSIKVTSLADRTVMPMVGPFSFKEHAGSSFPQRAVMPMVDPFTITDKQKNSEKAAMPLIGQSITVTSPVADRAVMPVIDPTSVISKALTTPGLPVNKESTVSPPKLDELNLSLKSAKKLVTPGFIAKMFKPTVPVSCYKDYGAPNRGFSCHACGCCFLSEASLLAHLKRPSVIITLKCEICCNCCLFYNRCALWLHFLSHSDSAFNEFDELMNMVKIKPFTKMGFADYKFGADCNMNVTDFTKEVSTVFENCPVCHPGGLTERKYELQPLKEHLGRLDTDNLEECMTCKRLLKNSCEKQLHQTLHEKWSNCPGCGVEHTNEREYYEHAQSFCCLYWLSSPLLICEICLQYYYSLQQFREHIGTQHSLSYFKCSQCHLAFHTFQACSQHLVSAHPNRPSFLKTPYLQILKCPLCKNIFSKPAGLQTHLKESHNSQLLKRIRKFTYRWKCCSRSNFVDRKALQAHMKSEHKVVKAPVLCDLCGKHISTLEKFIKHRAACLKVVASMMRSLTSEKGSSKIAAICKRVLQCRRCQSPSNVFFSTQVSYESHYRSSHSTSGRIPPPSLIDLKAAMTKPSSVPPQPVTASATSAVNSTKVQQTDSANAELKESAKAYLKRTIAVSDGKQKDAKKIKVIHQTPLSCSKCEFTSNERVAFQEHIKTHKENPSHHQCQECGLCFRSQVAVTRHMAMKHSIQSPVSPVVMPVTSPAVKPPVKPKYKPIKQKVEVPPPKVTPQTVTSPKVMTSPHSTVMECMVCYRIFTNDTLLRNHMRTHGMAFIHSKRTSSP